MAEDKKVKQETKTPAKEVKQETKTPAKEVKQETKKIRFLLPPAGRFLLPYNVGQEVDLPANQADEIVDMKYAEFVK